MRLTASCLIGFVATTAYTAPAIVHECGGLDSIAFLVEPVKDFANKAIRIAHIDAGEPGEAADHLLIFVAVDHPIDAEYFKCFRVSAGNIGFSSLNVAQTRASYDEQKGLLLVVPVSVLVFDKGVDRKSAGDLKVRVNRKNGISVTIADDLGKTGPEKPRIYVLASPPTSQVGLTLKGKYYWFHRVPPDEPCDFRFDGACYMESEFEVRTDL